MKKYSGIIIIALSIGIVIFLTAIKEEPPKRPQVVVPITVPTILVKSESVMDRITAHGTIRPRWETTLKSEVNGRVLSVSSSLLEGSRFSNRETLVTVQDTDYVATLSQAKADLAVIERQLTEEKQRAVIAKENWEASGIDGQASDLTMRKPQLAELKAAKESAHAALEKAQYNLSQTQIKAPYSGFVVERFVNPGDTVQIGNDIAKIYDNRIYEASIALTDKQFRRLADNPIGQEVRIKGTNTEEGVGRISRIEQRIDNKNRWRNIYIEISGSQSFLPGEFVTVAIPGREYNNALRIPDKYVMGDGTVWFVDSEDRLQRFSANILFHEQDRTIIESQPSLPSILSITINRDTYLPGSTVVSDNQTISPSSLADFSSGGQQ